MGLFKKKKAQPKTVDEINKNYVCLTVDPVNTINDLREGDWDQRKLQEGLTTGMLRYAKQSEVERHLEPKEETHE